VLREAAETVPGTTDRVDTTRPIAETPPETGESASDAGAWSGDTTLSFGKPFEAAGVVFRVESASSPRSPPP
jgi:hypothetical protein